MTYLRRSRKTWMNWNRDLRFRGRWRSSDSGDALIPLWANLDRHGNLLLADTGNNRIRKITPAGIITTIAGNSNGTTGFTGDGSPAVSTAFSGLWGMASDGVGDLIVADAGNNRVRKISSLNQAITDLNRDHCDLLSVIE